MGLYERLMGTDPNVHSSGHQIMAVIAEYRRGRLSAAQAVAAFTPPLDTTEANEAQTLVDALVAGSITFKELHDVLMLAEMRSPPYDNKAAVLTRLGF